MNDYRMDIIDTYIRKCAEHDGCPYEKTKLVYDVAYEFGILDIRAFAKHAGVTEDAVRRYFGDDDTDESEEPDEPDTVDEHVSQLEKDADNILDSAGPSPDGLLNQLDALNHQLNILTHIIAIHVKGGC